MTMLIDRQVLILQSIVENFITTNQPVGSKQIAQNIDFSSATIRNDMSKLEKEGLIKKTHISSGRVPSEKGYRYYVDYIKKDYELSNSENEKLKQLSGGLFCTFGSPITFRIHGNSNLLSGIPIGLGPETAECKLR